MTEKYILLVDDDTYTAWSLGSDLQDYARGADARLRVFTDAVDALTFIEQSEGLIWGAIVDLWMLDKLSGVEDPNKGYEIIEALRKRFPASKILVLSAHIDGEARTKLKASRVGCLKKPVGGLEVFEALQNIKA